MNPQACPDCSSDSSVVTAVTVPALGEESARVLITRRCTNTQCQLKFPVFKGEDQLDEDERNLWRRR